jgi:tRNA pseudouridine55 synthase
MATGRASDSGVVLVDKPAGMTSHDVVAIVRRASGESRIGHAGTLDPFATGLLVLLLGRATRLLPYLNGEPKTYEASIRFGSETDTDDATGAPTATAAVPTLAAIEGALPSLTGAIDQVPPAYSAKQVGGQRAYRAARAGAPLTLDPVQITVHDWTITGWEDDTLSVRIRCSGGTYIRALARDLGRAAGGAAHLATLRRVASGPYTVDAATSVESIKGGALPVASPLPGLAGCVADRIDPDAVERVVRGLTVPAGVTGERGALLDGDGVLVAVAERQGDAWQPRVVLRDA